MLNKCILTVLNSWLESSSDICSSNFSISTQVYLRASNFSLFFFFAFKKNHYNKSIILTPRGNENIYCNDAIKCLVQYLAPRRHLIDGSYYDHCSITLAAVQAWGG